MTAADPTESRPWEALQALLERDDQEAIRELVPALDAGDAARCFERLSPDERDAVLGILGPDQSAILLELLPWKQGEDMLEWAEPGAAAAILEALPTDEQADLIDAIDPDKAASILAEMEPELARDAKELASYPNESAGGLMNREFFAFPRSMTAGEVIDALRRQVDSIAEQAVQYTYVVDARGALVGVLPLRELLLAPGDRLLQDLMVPNPASVSVDLDLDALDQAFTKRPFLGLPVVDGTGLLVGVLHRTNFEEAWAERADSDHLKAQGIVGGEELRSMPVFLRSRRRFSWLSVNIALNFGAAAVIASYEETLSQVIVLAVFLPIISDMSGCSGNQAVAVSMRELTLGVIKPVDVFYVWRKEAMVGLINGLGLGLLLGVAAWVWKGNAFLGLIVGGALATNTLVAVSIGGVVPLLLKQFKVDPALAAGPILTTLTDMCGFFLALSFAAAALSRLT